jgi:hypothetical protein
VSKLVLNPQGDVLPTSWTFIGEPYSGIDPATFSDADLRREIIRIDLDDRQFGFHGWRATSRARLTVVLAARGVAYD